MKWMLLFVLHVERDRAVFETDPKISINKWFSGSVTLQINQRRYTKAYCNWSCFEVKKSSTTQEYHKSADV